MKTILLTLLLFALPVVAAAQSAGGDEPLNSYKSYNTGQHLTSTTQRTSFGATSQRKAGGFILDCATAKPGARTFNLRQPEDVKRDLRNVSFDPVTGKAAGFKLFAINF